MRRLLLVLHRWLGRLLILPMLLQASTGIVLAVAPAFDNLSGAAHSGIAGPPRQPSEVLAAALRAAPPGLQAMRYRPPGQAHEMAVIDLGRTGQRLPAMRMLIDPVSLVVVATDTHPDRVLRFVHRLHEVLLVPGPLGHQLIGWFGIGLLLMTATGIWNWWQRTGRWRGLAMIFRNARRFRLQLELHGLAGIWLAVMLLLQAVSGASMAFPETFAAMLGLPAPTRSGGHPHDPPKALDIDAVMARAISLAPHAEAVDIRLPGNSGRPLTVILRRNGSTLQPATIITMTPDASRVLTIQDPATQPFRAGILIWMRALHSATVLGPAWRVLVTVSGVALFLLSLTGGLMWLFRHRIQPRRAASAVVRRAAIPR